MGVTLTAATRLGDNTATILQSVVTELSSAGVDIVVDATVAEPDLLFACGLLTVKLIDQGAPYEVVAAPIFPNERAPVYRSVIIAKTLRHGPLMAVNEFGSWSGWHGYLADGRERPADVVTSGAHLASIDAVAEGEADFAAIDSSIWRDLGQRGAQPSSLIVVGQTRDYPAPPFSLHRSIDDHCRDGIRLALHDVADVRSADIADYHMMRSAI